MSAIRQILTGRARSTDAPVTTKETLIFFAVLSTLYGVAGYLGLQFLLGLAIIGIGLYFLIINNELLWILAVILGYLPVFWKTTDEFTAAEIGQALVFYGGLLWWFYKRLFLLRQRIKWSTGGILFMAFFVYTLLLIPISLANDAEPLFLTRETFVFGSALLFIPLRHIINTRGRQKLLLLMLLIILIPIGIKNMLMYQQKVISAVAYWQVGASRQTESYTFFLFGSIVFLALLISEQKLRYWLLWASTFAITLGAAILAFYRSVWAAIIFGLGFMGMYLGMPYWRKTASYAVIGVSGFMIVVSLWFSLHGALSIVGTSLADRFISVQKYKVDPSLINRNVESAALLDQTGMHLIIGHGTASRVTFRNYITHVTVRTTWSHNGYAWLLHHYGILGTLLLLSAYLTYIARAWILQRRVKLMTSMPPAHRYRMRAMLSAGAAAGAAFMMLSVTSNQFLARDAALAMAMVWGMTDLWGDQIENAETLSTFPMDE